MPHTTIVCTLLLQSALHAYKLVKFFPKNSLIGLDQKKIKYKKVKENIPLHFLSFHIYTWGLVYLKRIWLWTNNKVSNWQYIFKKQDQIECPISISTCLENETNQEIKRYYAVQIQKAGPYRLPNVY